MHTLVQTKETIGFLIKKETDYDKITQINQLKKESRLSHLNTKQTSATKKTHNDTYWDLL